MAPVTEPPRSSQVALLELEKGTNAPTSQLHEAAQIIGVALRAHEARILGSEESSKSQKATTSAPKEEWVLRWLLKKLKATNGPVNYRLDSDSWLLLRVLLDRIPPKTIASILNEHKFLAVLEDALVELEKISAEDEQSGSENGLQEISTKSQKRGQKRKRVDGEDESSDSTIAHEFPPSSWASTLLYILTSIRKLVALSNQQQGTDGAARSHLKLALRGEPEVAANILGKSFRIATLALPILAGLSELTRLLSVLPSVFDIWELRSSSQAVLTKSQSNGALCASFFPQALELLTALQKLSSSAPEKDGVVRPIERAIALHVVLPARAEFSSKHSPGIHAIDEKPDMNLVKLVLSNIKSCFGDDEDGAEGEGPKPIAVSDETLPALMDIAIRSVPRDTFRRQTAEAPWLETLFIALSELAGCSLETEDTAMDDTTSSPKALENLFQVVIERKVSISVKTLSMFTMRFTGLFASVMGEVSWNLVSKLIIVGVDVFLPNSGLKESKHLLDALLRHIQTLPLGSSSAEDSEKEIYEVIKSGIIIPLLNGFAGARDISTFAEIWFEQLADVESTLDSEDGHLFSLWEDDDISEAYSSAVSKSLSDNQIVGQAQAILKEIGEVDTSSAKKFARIVILNSIATAEMRVDGTTEVEETYGSLLKILASAIPKEKPRWQWRLWRLARNILDKRLRWVDTSFADLESALMKEAAEFFKDLRKGPESGSAMNEYLEALEVFRITILALGTDNGSQYASEVDTVITQVVSFLGTVKSMDDETSPDGRFQTVNSPRNLAIGYLVTLLSKPGTVIRLTSDQRQSLFDAIISLAVSTLRENSDQTSRSSSSRVAFLDILDGFASYRWLLDAQPAAYDIVEVLSSRIKKDPKAAPFYISSMVNVPARLIPKHQRGKVLDLLLLEVLLGGEVTNSGTYTEVFAFMAALVSQPKSTAQITSDPEVLWKIADATKLPGTDEDQLIHRSFRNLHQAVLDGFLVASDEQRQKYFELSYTKSRKAVDKLNTIDYSSMVFFMARVSLSAQARHRKGAEIKPREEDVGLLRQKVLELLLGDLKSSRKFLKKGDGNAQESRLRDILVALEDFEDLAQGNKEVNKILKKTEEDIMDFKGMEGDMSLQRIVKRRVLSTQKQGKSSVRSLMQCSTILPVQQLYEEDQQIFFGETHQRLSLMSTEQIIEFIHDIQKPGFSGDDAPYRLLLAGMAVASCDAIEDRDSAASAELTSLFTAVTESMHGSRSIEQFSLATECLDVLLRTQSRSISQWNVDNVLGGILTSMTGSGPQIAYEHGGVIYTRLCRLMGTLISLYRRKLGGRFHLVLPVTQGLLRCLFTNPKHGKQVRNRSSLPPWLALTRNDLTTEHVVQYTRVLTSLCDPTMSAVNTQRGPGNDLTDPTKKVKRVAGQHLQYLIMEYAQCQLRNSLMPEMKAALMPGLYAVLDVMSKDMMRTMNAAMDSSSRAVFKGLYEDYNRFGKWNKN
ncbi:hypothetical protein FQN54_009031 [Arachnomyces sp. PD_36]|nr:hypothetical protein FQN54_009031 [Arachnomyces sp. PD_36]